MLDQCESGMKDWPRAVGWLYPDLHAGHRPSLDGTYDWAHPALGTPIEPVGGPYGAKVLGLEGALS